MLDLYFPLWVVMFFPPMLYLTISCCAIFPLLAYLLIILLSKKKSFNIKSYLSLVGISILLNILNLILYALPELLYKVSFIKDNLIKPLETNPYTNIMSFIYVVLILFLDIYIVYKLLRKKIIINNIKTGNLIIISLLLIPYLFFIPSNKIIKSEYNSLEDYAGITLKNTNKLKSILKNIESGEYINSYVINTHVEPYTIDLYMKEIDINHQIMFERDASIILYLVSDANEVIYHYNNKEYKYTINRINEIFKNVKKLSLEDIFNRYEDVKFNDYIYLGRIKSYDVFDESEVCNLDKQLLFTYLNKDYYLGCASLDNVYLYSEKEKISIKDALKGDKVTSSDLTLSLIDFDN